MGFVPRVQSKLSRALHAHRGKKLLQDLQTQESATIQRAIVRFRGARVKGAMTFVECLGFSQEDTMESPVEGNLRQEPGVARRNGTCWWGVGRKPPAYTPYLA